MATLYADGDVYQTQVEGQSGENIAFAEFQLWIPSESKVERFIVLTWGSNQSSLGMIYDSSWQKLAKLLDCGLIDCYFVSGSIDTRWDLASKGSGRTLLQAIDTFSKKSGHPELTSAKLILVGDSQGGQFSYDFATWNHGKVLGFVSLNRTVPSRESPSSHCRL